MNPLQTLAEYGQSPWLDYIRRDLLTTGELARLVAEEGLRGLTSNPTIFRQAIAQSSLYDESLARLAADPTLDAKTIFERLAIADIQGAADVLAEIHRESHAADGYASLEVSPALAHDTAGTCLEARRLFVAVDRPNVMIKVPATAAGILAIETLIGEGIPINVTLLFSRQAYEQVVLAYLGGLEQLRRSGGDLSRVASVASFFVSRIDSAVDRELEDLAAGAAEERAAALRGLQGKTAVANAKLAYEIFERRFHGPRWEALSAAGARPQRLLWASTSTKNPTYPDLLYVEPLIGPETVNTLPPATWKAVLDHGVVARTVDQGLDEAKAMLAELADAGVSLDAVTEQLLEAGVSSFADAFDDLLAAISEAQERLRAATLDGRARLPAGLTAAVASELALWQKEHRLQRLWKRDATLWTGGDEGRWLGWLDATTRERQRLGELTEFAEEIRRAGHRHVLLLGMGGSSLFPDVLAHTFGATAGYPSLDVLDSTDPAQILATEARLDLTRTLVVVASKSGTTLEPDALLSYFWGRLRDQVGEAAGSRVVAITDPGSMLAERAGRDGFRRIFLGEPAIGGRFSALSPFGLLPAALLGLNVAALLDRAARAMAADAPGAPVAGNLGLGLGLLIGVAARRGRDKLTILSSPGIASFGAWLEQLIDESTGKEGKAILVIDGERPATKGSYGDDRLFVALRLSGADDGLDPILDELAKARQPVVSIQFEDRYDLGGQVFHWEIATAVAGAVLGIHPFDQPDVESSKVATRELSATYEERGAFPPETPLAFGDGVVLYADEANTAALRSAGDDASIEAMLTTHLARLQPGDYFALLAYLAHSEANLAVLQDIRHRVRERYRVATSVGFGPRFLHSTGQAFKGGPNSGVFLQITADDDPDLPIPDRQLTFGVVKAAQALGDSRVLSERGRRLLRLHLKGNSTTGLERLAKLITGDS